MSKGSKAFAGTGHWASDSQGFPLREAKAKEKRGTRKGGRAGTVNEKEIRKTIKNYKGHGRTSPAGMVEGETRRKAKHHHHKWVASIRKRRAIGRGGRKSKDVSREESKESAPGIKHESVPLRHVTGNRKILTKQDGTFLTCQRSGRRGGSEAETKVKGRLRKRCERDKHENKNFCPAERSTCRKSKGNCTMKRR